MARPIESVRLEPMPTSRIAALVSAGFVASDGHAYICQPVAGGEMAVRFGHQSGVYIVHILGEATTPLPWRYIVNKDFDSVLAEAVRASDHLRSAMQ